MKSLIMYLVKSQTKKSCYLEYFQRCYTGSCCNYKIRLKKPVFYSAVGYISQLLLYLEKRRENLNFFTCDGCGRLGILTVKGGSFRFSHQSFWLSTSRFRRSFFSLIWSSRSFKYLPSRPKELPVRVKHAKKPFWHLIVLTKSYSQV